MPTRDAAAEIDSTDHRPPAVSFEFFPPKSAEAEERLWESMRALAPLRPRFVSVTYGAGGSTRERTHATVRRILAETLLVPAAHLTSVSATRGEVDAVARAYWESGVRHVVALRGDPPGELGGVYRPHPEGYADAAGLVAGLARVAPFEISVAAYPETHFEAASPARDLDNLKRKLDAGAVRAITQCFFDSELYFRFLDRARRAGIDVPIVPGILPVTNLEAVRRFARRCNASLPDPMLRLFDGTEQDTAAQERIGLDYIAAMCRRLRGGGIDSFHFYTLNRAEPTAYLCRAIGMAEPVAAAA
jgi:methylenetetrahydrofolate reductase (NADPH)